MDETDFDFLFLAIALLLFCPVLNVALAERFNRSKWKWGILGFFFGIFSVIWLLAFGKKKEGSNGRD